MLLTAVFNVSFNLSICSLTFMGIIFRNKKEIPALQKTPCHHYKDKSVDAV